MVNGIIAWERGERSSASWQSLGKQSWTRFPSREPVQVFALLAEIESAVGRVSDSVTGQSTTDGRVLSGYAALTGPTANTFTVSEPRHEGSVNVRVCLAKFQPQFASVFLSMAIRIISRQSQSGSRNPCSACDIDRAKRGCARPRAVSGGGRRGGGGWGRGGKTIKRSPNKNHHAKERQKPTHNNNTHPPKNNYLNS
jgi:hypothetical protein